MSKVIDDPEIYKEAKRIADETYKKPSAYKSGFIVKKYKELGGTYSGEKPDKTGIARWFKEEWKDVAGLDYPVYRPTKKVTKNTPLTPSEIEPTNLAEQIVLKQKIKGDSNLPPFKGLGLAPDYFKSVEKALHKYYGKDVELYESTRKDKKFMVISPEGKKIHFGQKGYSDWHLHGDPIRRDNFRRRNAKWADAPKWSPAHLAWWVLW